DLNSVEFSVDENQIIVKLPEAYIISHEIDERSLKVYDSTKNIFNPITVEDVNDFEAEQKAVNEQKALDKGLLEEARKNAVVAMTQLLKKLEGFGDYELIYK
ncbi:MAG: DUF4230 domain-containing protein, partial [Eubacteriaceae bacterium]|nr:DUF4230 domain-containing protein [Eubacteriaceae bacterium]